MLSRCADCARTPMVTYEKAFGSRSCTMDDTDDTDGSEKLIEVLKTASHNGLIHRGELRGVGCQNQSNPNRMHCIDET